MLDIKWIRKHQGQVKEAARNKGMSDFSVELSLLVDEKRRELGRRADELRAERNRLSAQKALFVSQKQIQEAENKKEQVRQCNAALNEIEAQLHEHVRIGEDLDLFDIPRSVKVAGTCNYYLKGMGLYLHRAVQQLALDLLADRGFTVMDVPLKVREETLVNAAFFPPGEKACSIFRHAEAGFDISSGGRASVLLYTE